MPRRTVPPRATTLASSLGWTVAYAAAMQLGRSVTLPGEPLALIWPACGVATLWLLGRRGGVLALDLLLLSAVTFTVNHLTGLSVGLSAWFLLVNVAQGLLGAAMIRRLCPDLWGCGGTATFDSVGRLFRLVAVAALSSLVAALITAVGLAWSVAQPTTVDLAILWGRNIYGFLTVIALTHLLAHAWRFRDPARPVLPRCQGVELTWLTVVTLGVFAVAFLQSSLSMAYVPAVVTIWAGLRFTPPVVAIHATLAGALAIGTTVVGDGPFAVVVDTPTRVLLVQLLITILIVEGLSLAAVRNDQWRLLREVEAGSREAEAQAGLLSTIVDTIQPGLVVLDPVGHPTRTNEPAAVLLAMYPAVTAADETRPPAGSPGEAWASVWRHLADQEEPPPFDLRLGGPEGTTVAEVRPRAMREGPDRTGTVVLLTDVTAERAARDGLTGFAGTVAHDLRGPLSGVKGWSHALAEELEGDHPDLALAATMASRVVSAASRMDDLIGDLLTHAVSRDGALHPVTVSLDRIALEVAESLGTPGRVVVHDLVEVHADEALVRHLVANLVGNAVKYVAPGTVAEVSLHARPDGEMVEVRICDNGIGIPADQREGVFEQFHRVHADYPGTGLGLAMCRTIVERHGGEIRVEGGEGGGTCVVFTLPAPPRPLTATSPAPTVADATPGAGARTSAPSPSPAVV